LVKFADKKPKKKKKAKLKSLFAKIRAAATEQGQLHQLLDHPTIAASLAYFHCVLDALLEQAKPFTVCWQVMKSPFKVW
jgi:hypothetical protein